MRSKRLQKKYLKYILHTWTEIIMNQTRDQRVPPRGPTLFKSLERSPPCVCRPASKSWASIYSDLIMKLGLWAAPYDQIWLHWPWMVVNSTIMSYQGMYGKYFRLNNHHSLSMRPNPIVWCCLKDTYTNASLDLFNRGFILMSVISWHSLIPRILKLNSNLAQFKCVCTLHEFKKIQV